MCISDVSTRRKSVSTWLKLDSRHVENAVLYLYTCTIHALFMKTIFVCLLQDQTMTRSDMWRFTQSLVSQYHPPTHPPTTITVTGLLLLLSSDSVSLSCHSSPLSWVSAWQGHVFITQVRVHSHACSGH